MTKDDKEKFQKADKCHICEKKYNKTDVRVRDHCHITGEKLDLMSQKGVYPYDFMDSFDKFNEKLPSKEDFYSILNDEHITDDQYKHAQNVWNTFNLKNMGEYHDLYLKSDILLLADVFENFRKTCLQYYKLDPCHYFTSPGLSWDAMLKMTDIKLELMTDIDMFQFIEKGMRGGISYIANRYGKSNNKYMKTYDEKTPSKYIMYLDANNLYGWAMSQYLPTGGFKWMTKNHIDKIDLAKYTEDSNKGLILEVDLAYPEELHDLHNDYPLGPEKIKVNKDMLSNYCQEIAYKFNVSTGLVHKLIPTLSNKEKYVLHYRNLQLYTDLGLKITKVHRVLEFNQSAWLKQYIDFNTEKRTNAKNAFEKDFFKLMNNSVFGKTMENIIKRVDVRLVTDENKPLKMAAKPTYVSSKIFNENLVAVHKIKETLTLNRQAYVANRKKGIANTVRKLVVSSQQGFGLVQQMGLRDNSLSSKKMTTTNFLRRPLYEDQHVKEVLLFGEDELQRLAQSGRGKGKDNIETRYRSPDDEVIVEKSFINSEDENFPLEKALDKWCYEK
ncbi:uncharacterized protein [Montipora capricornis]|uniref:uncharacterized protein n=1 Tax=Montipora capricornis TaxID=246305 RepID=UPI0035F1B5CC